MPRLCVYRSLNNILSLIHISNKPEKSLLECKKKNAGRNKQGKITVRHQGGGNKVKYRICLLYTSPPWC